MIIRVLPDWTFATRVPTLFYSALLWSHPAPEPRPRRRAFQAVTSDAGIKHLNTNPGTIFFFQVSPKVQPGSTGIFQTFDLFPKTTGAPANAAASSELLPGGVQHKLAQQISEATERKPTPPPKRDRSGVTAAAGWPCVRLEVCVCGPSKMCVCVQILQPPTCWNILSSESGARRAAPSSDG